MRRPFVRILAVAGIGLVAACAAPATPTPGAQAVEVRIAALTGPTTMGLVGMIDDDPYTVSVYGTADEVVPLVVQGDIDVAVLPANLAATLYTRTDAEVQVAAINALGVLSILESGDTVDSLADLRGRTVYSTGKGTTPQYVLEHLLDQSGLVPGVNVTIEYLSEPTEVAAHLAAEAGSIGVLPQPYATSVLNQYPQTRTAIDLSAVWDELNPDSHLVTAVTVVRREFADANPEVMANLLTDLAESVAFVNDSPDEAGPLIVEAGVIASADVAAQAIPASHLVLITGDPMRQALDGYLQVLYDANPEAVGGAVPGADFYFG